MNPALESATEKAVQSLASEVAPSESNTQETLETKSEVSSDQQTNQSPQEQQTVAQAVLELEKTGKFTFKGKEYTVKDLEEMEKGNLRQGDYTKKTKELAEDRKYYENLYFDIEKVKRKPHLAAEFYKHYPEKFHAYLEEAMESTSEQDVVPPKEEQRVQTPSVQKPDLQLIKRLDKLEKVHYEQEVSKAKTEINQIVSNLSKKYPDARSRDVMAQAYDLHSSGTKLTSEVWEDLFKTSHNEMEQWFKSRQAAIVKKQTEVNKKSQDVESGGGTVGSAPKKFKNVNEITKFAEENYRG